MAIDGLLFARPDDHKAERFTKATRFHDTKLGMLPLFPLIIGTLAQNGPRYKNDQAFAQATVINLQLLKADGNAVLERLPGGFPDLNALKQNGFYATANGQAYVAPRQNVDPTLAKLVYQLAWRATTSIDFLLKKGNLERYIPTAQEIRDKLSEEAHQALERTAADVVDQLFGETDQRVQ